MSMFNMDIDVQKSDMGGGSVPGEVDEILTVELFKEIVHRCGTSGSMRACHAAGPGSIPGRDKFPG